MDISVNHLTHVYNEQTLFEDLSFHVRAGKKICIAGASGSGKTTLLMTLMGLVVPTRGEIRIGDELLTEKSAWPLRSKISYVAQEPDLGEGVVIERIRRPFDYRANAHLEWDRQAVSDYCGRFRLSEKLLEKDAGELSGGEKQRVALIIALLLRRPILILDEPVSALDVEIKGIIREELMRDSSRTVLFVSHESALLDIADDTIELTAAKGAS